MDVALQGVQQDQKTVLGLLTLSEEPQFNRLEKDYLDPAKTYKIIFVSRQSE